MAPQETVRGRDLARRHRHSVRAPLERSPLSQMTSYRMTVLPRALGWRSTSAGLQVEADPQFWISRFPGFQSVPLLRL